MSTCVSHLSSIAKNRRLFSFGSPVQSELAPKEPTCLPVHWEELTSLWEWTLWAWGHRGRDGHKAGSAEFVEAEVPISC